MSHKNIRQFMILHKIAAANSKCFYPVGHIALDEKTLKPLYAAKLGPSLKLYLKEVKLDGKERVSIVEDIISAVFVTHTQRIIHRNISTGTFYREGDHFVIWDFDNAAINVGCRSFVNKPRNRFVVPTWNTNLPPEFYTPEPVTKDAKDIEEAKKDEKVPVPRSPPREGTRTIKAAPLKKGRVGKKVRGAKADDHKDVKDVKDVKEVKIEKEELHPRVEIPKTRLYGYELDVWNMGLVIFEVLFGTTAFEASKMTVEDIHKNPDKFSAWLMDWTSKQMKDIPEGPVYAVVVRQCLNPKERNSSYGIKNICDIKTGALFEAEDKDIEDKYEKKIKRTNFQGKFEVKNYQYIDYEDLATAMIHDLAAVLSSDEITNRNQRPRRFGYGNKNQDLETLVANIRKRKPNGAAMRILAQLLEHIPSGGIEVDYAINGMWPMVQIAKILVDESYEVEFECMFSNFMTLAAAILKKMTSHNIYY